MDLPVVIIGNGIGGFGVAFAVVDVLIVYTIADSIPDVNDVVPLVAHSSNSSLGKYICRPGLSMRNNLICGGNSTTATGGRR